MASVMHLEQVRLCGSLQQKRGRLSMFRDGGTAMLPYRLMAADSGQK